MRQAQKVQDVIVSTGWMVFLALLLSVTNAAGQRGDFSIQKNIIKAIHYPESLKQNCIPAFTNILIDISDKGEIESIYMADSAPKDLKDEFIKARSKFNTNLIKQVITSQKLKNCGILIPVFYVFARDYCPNSVEATDNLGDNYFAYQSKAYYKPTLNLKPIVITIYKPVE